MATYSYSKFFIPTLISIIIMSAISFTTGRISGKHSHVCEQQSTYLTSRDTISEWQTLQLALMKTESEFNPLAVGKTGDVGVLQITKIWVNDVNRILGRDEYIHEDAFSPERSIEMFSIIQNKYNPNHDIIKAITLHNPRGESIGYSKRVLQNMEWAQQYEYLRALVIQGD